MAEGMDFSSPDTQRFLINMLAGMGRQVGGGQGAAEAIGAPTQELIKAQSYQNLLKQLAGGKAGGRAGAGAGTTPKTEGVKEMPVSTSPRTGKITIEGSELGEVGKVLSGLQMPEEKAAGGEGGWGLGNFLKAPW